MLRECILIFSECSLNLDICFQSNGFPCPLVKQHVLFIYLQSRLIESRKKKKTLEVDISAVRICAA